MSQENVELFRKALEAYNRRDIEAILEIWHPEAEWYPFTAQVEGDNAYHGHEGLRQWWANVEATFEEREASVEEVRDLGDAVVALGHLRARGMGSGIEIDQVVFHLARFRHGKVAHWKLYLNRAEALEAAGLRE
jgi:ketosteroid isomerase-like protein